MEKIPVPHDRHDEPVSDTEVTQLESHIGNLLEAGWTDFEIVYDLARTNGVTMRETSRVFGAIHLVAIIRKMRGDSDGTRPTDASRGRVQQEGSETGTEQAGQAEAHTVRQPDNADQSPDLGGRQAKGDDKKATTRKRQADSGNPARRRRS